MDCSGCGKRISGTFYEAPDGGRYCVKCAATLPLTPPAPRRQDPTHKQTISPTASQENPTIEPGQAHPDLPSATNEQQVGADSLQDSTPSAHPRSKRWRVVSLLILSSFKAHFDRVCLTIALPVMIQTLELTNTQQGIALLAFFWSYSLLQIPAGMLVDRYGVRTAYIIGIGVCT